MSSSSGDKKLFPSASGSKKPNYGTNSSSELIKNIPSNVVENKLDEVLDAVKIVDNTCDFEKCKTKTNLVGQDCNHCKKRFCFKHNLPEIHGCGEAVKKEERKNFLKPVPIKTIRAEEEHNKAKGRLDSKLKDMQRTRLAKAPGAGKSKKK